MIKTILWDFDGVILDSMKIKGNGFIELFKDFNVNDIKILEQYHYNNGGVSRFEKIRYFYNAILKKQVSENKINSLAGKFSKIIQSKIFNKSNLIQDSLLFIKKNYKKYNFHIIVRNIIKNYKYKKNEVIFIGDAMADYFAAKINKIDFYGYNNKELQNKSKQYIIAFKNIKF